MADLRPMALGEIVDRAATFWRSNWRPLFRLFLGFQLAQYVVMKAWEVVLTRFSPAARGGGQLFELARSDPAEALRQVGAGAGSAMVVMLFALLVSQIAAVAATRFAFPRLTGSDGPGLGEAVAHAGKKLKVTSAAFLVSVGWGLLVALLFQLPTIACAGASYALTQRQASGPAALFAGVALLLGAGAALVTVVWFIVRFVLLAQVVALEDADVGQTFRRTRELSSGRVGPGFTGWVKGRLTVLITVVGGILFLITFVTGIPELLLQASFGNAFDPVHADPSAVPLYLSVPAELLQVVVGAIFSPLYVVFQVMFYLDLRIRREALDIELELVAVPG